MTDRNNQTANAREKSRIAAKNRRYEVQLQIASVVAEHTGCDECKQRNFCRHKRPDGTIQYSCMSHTELAKTLMQHKVLTPQNKSKWTATQVKSLLETWTPTPAGVGPLDEFFG